MSCPLKINNPTLRAGAKANYIAGITRSHHLGQEVLLD
jgi:hypothetical protein